MSAETPSQNLTGAEPGLSPCDTLVIKHNDRTDAIVSDGEPRSATLATGAAFGRYQIVSELGAGGMGTVYLALDPSLDRHVALKVPRLGNVLNADVVKSRFLREARAGARLRHQYIAAVYDVGEENEVPYAAMEFIQGTSLDKYLEKNRMSLQAACRLVVGVALAMQHAHDNRVVHRDLKPSNIMVLPDGSPRVMDFGLSRLLDDREIAVTREGQILGSPAWMSPEQVRSTHTDHRTDIYSLGVIFYELLTGSRPFKGTLTSVLLAVTTGDFAAPLSIRPEMDQEICEICMRMMALDSEQRFQSMKLAAAAIQQWLRRSTLHLPAADTPVASSPATEPAARAAASKSLPAQTVRRRTPAATDPEKIAPPKHAKTPDASVWRQRRHLYFAVAIMLCSILIMGGVFFSTSTSDANPEPVTKSPLDPTRSAVPQKNVADYVESQPATTTPKAPVSTGQTFRLDDLD